MGTTTETGSRIKVDSDGVKLGWNVLALVATFGLGLYVSSIVTPLEVEVERSGKLFTKEIEEIASTCRGHVAVSNTLFNKITVDHYALSEKVIRLDSVVVHLVKEVNRILARNGQHTIYNNGRGTPTHISKPSSTIPSGKTP